MKRIVNENDVTKWLAAQQADITRKRGTQAKRGQ
jgi:hypothetical protein